MEYKPNSIAEGVAVIPYNLNSLQRVRPIQLWATERLWGPATNHSACSRSDSGFPLSTYTVSCCSSAALDHREYALVFSWSTSKMVEYFG